MNRLTHKDIAIQLDKDIESTITISENVSRDIYLKCSYLEDFLEEHDCETLSDYTKQVRKKVVQEIKDTMIMYGTKTIYNSNGDAIGTYECLSLNEIKNILDQIQGKGE